MADLIGHLIVIPGLYVMADLIGRLIPDQVGKRDARSEPGMTT